MSSMKEYTNQSMDLRLLKKAKETIILDSLDEAEALNMFQDT